MRTVFFTSVLFMGDGSCGDSCPTDPTDGDCPDGGSSGGDSSGGGTDDAPPGDPHGGTLVHTDAGGGVQSVAGVVFVEVDRLGTAVTGIELSESLVLQVGDTLESVATGWSVGTGIEVDRIRIPEVPLVLDRAGVASVPAGVAVAFDLTVLEPGAAAVAETLFTGLPALRVTVTNGRIAVAPWSDGLGGTFEVR